MDRTNAVKLAEQMIHLLAQQGIDNIATRSTLSRQSARGALARMAAQRIPDDAHAAVLGQQGGKPAFVALSADGGALYLLEPRPFDPAQQQSASARCRVIPIDHARVSVEMESRWWDQMGAEVSLTQWRIEVSGVLLEFTTERLYDDAMPSDEAFAAALCKAAGLPLGPEGDEALANAA